MNYYSMGTKKKRKCFLNSVPLQFQPAQENQEMLTEKMLTSFFKTAQAQLSLNQIIIFNIKHP